MSEMFPSKEFSSGAVLDKGSSSNSFESGERGNIAKPSHLCGGEDGGEMKDIHSFSSELRLHQEQEEITKLASMNSGNSELIKPQKENSYTFRSALVALLMNYQGRFRQLEIENVSVPSYGTACTKIDGRRLSTHEILLLAGERFIQSCSQTVDDLSLLGHPFGSSLFHLSTEETRDVELGEYLLASAEKVGQQQFNQASKLLNGCEKLSSNKGNPVQRLAYYFCEALREKIDNETGRITSRGSGKRKLFDLEEEMMTPRACNISFHQELPFSQVSQYSGMQAIVENVSEAKRVHIIDLGIMSGSHCVVLMQALAARCECPLEHLKITAVGTKSKQKIEETGKRLMSFAESITLPFSFNVVMVADMLDLNEDLFEVKAEEVIAVHSSHLLSTMIARPDRLERLMRVIKNINPCVMVVTDVEANLNSPIFVNRFIEALFFYSALFDSMGDCMGHVDPNRMILESIYCGQAIRNIVATEGEERKFRRVNINFWRAFFARFGMAEIELSMSSMYQASLVVQKFACGSSCSLYMDGNCLLVGWKGAPIVSLSAWKFHSE